MDQRAVITKTLDDLSDSEIKDIDILLKTLEELCDEAIIKTQSIERLRVKFFDENGTWISFIIFQIDWENYDVRFSSGDKLVSIERHLSRIPGAEESDIETVKLKSLSETVDEIRKIMRGLRDKLAWRTATWDVVWNTKAEEIDKVEISKKFRLNSVPTASQEKNEKDFWLRIGATVEKVPEISVAFYSEKTSEKRKKDNLIASKNAAVNGVYSTKNVTVTWSTGSLSGVFSLKELHDKKGTKKI